MANDDTKRVLDLIAVRRARHREKGYNDDYDDMHDQGELGRAALNYIAVSLLTQSFRADQPPDDTDPFYGYAKDSKLPELSWPFEPDHWKPTDVREMLVESVGFLVAEIERIDRATVRSRVLQ